MHSRLPFECVADLILAFAADSTTVDLFDQHLTRIQACMEFKSELLLKIYNSRVELK